MAQRRAGSLQQKGGGGDKPGGRKEVGWGEEQMPSFWFGLKRTLISKCESSDNVHDPKVDSHRGSLRTRKPAAGICSGRCCTKSIADIKDVIHHGSKTGHVEKPENNCSPRSVGSSEILNPITHDVVLQGNSRSELKITGFGSYHDGGARTGGQSASFRRASKIPQSKLNGERRRNYGSEDSSLSSAVFAPRSSRYADPLEKSAAGLICQKCDEQFLKLERLEAHHLAEHAVTELVEGDSSRKIVEMICKTGLTKPDGSSGRMERILKIQNLQRSVASFEEYREVVKLKASKLQKKHPRCLADGNELLRFHGTTMSCSPGKNGASGLCTSKSCGACQILRRGFSKEEGAVGVFTTATSGRAVESIGGDDPAIKKALFVCRVIAGRVRKPLDNNHQELADQSGFDSLAGKVGSHANIEELYLFNPRALLPCFLVVCGN